MIELAFPFFTSLSSSFTLTTMAGHYLFGFLQLITIIIITVTVITNDRISIDINCLIKNIRIIRFSLLENIYNFIKF